MDDKLSYSSWLPGKEKKNEHEKGGVGIIIKYVTFIWENQLSVTLYQVFYHQQCSFMLLTTQFIDCIGLNDCLFKQGEDSTFCSFKSIRFPFQNMKYFITINTKTHQFVSFIANQQR